MKLAHGKVEIAGIPEMRIFEWELHGDEIVKGFGLSKKDEAR